MPIGARFPDTLRDARAGDEAALTALYRDLAPAVLGYLRGQGGLEPEDLASEVFVAVVRGLPRFEGDEPALRSWVFTIAHRRLLDERRRLARHPVEPLDPVAHEEAAGAGDAEREALARVEAAAVLDALDRLTPDQRSVILLRLVADLPIAHAARILGKTVGAVKSLQRRALLRLTEGSAAEPVSSGPPRRSHE